MKEHVGCRLPLYGMDDDETPGTLHGEKAAPDLELPLAEMAEMAWSDQHTFGFELGSLLCDTTEYVKDRGSIWQAPLDQHVKHPARTQPRQDSTVP